MLRAGSCFLTQFAINSETKCVNSSFALEFVRWRRKPRWLPVAKSKMFRVPQRVPQRPDERSELMRLHNHYKTQMRSLRWYLREETQRKFETSSAEHIVLTPAQEEAEFQRCIEINEEWNQKIAAERDVRLSKERAERETYIRKRLELALEREEEQRERIEAIVRREKELSNTYITREKLDTAIEAALANPVDYNFSIDLQGNLHYGRTTIPGGTISSASDTVEIDKKQLKASNE